MTGRARALYDEQLRAVYQQRDRVFAWLFAGQWLFAILIALLWSPYGWEGKARTIHVHVYYAVLLGGALTIPPILIMRARPGSALTRHAVAATQMLWSALIIHLTGGRIEAHFHVFGSLAFLAFYRDWTVLGTATLFVAGDHLLRGLLWSESVYGIPNPEWWRFIEHASWVSFENVVLVLGIFEARREMRVLASRQAELEAVNASIEHTVARRTAELKTSESRFRTLAGGAPIGIIEVDHDGKITFANPRFCEIVSCARGELTDRVWLDLTRPDDRAAAVKCWADREGESSAELRVGSADATRWVTTKASPLGDRRYVITFEDVTARHAAEHKLSELNQQLVAIARTAGMAEVAAGVLHNVGNVLNSVNTSAEVAAHRIRTSKVGQLQKAVALLGDHATDLGGFFATDKGRALPGYLARIGERLAESDHHVLDELELLRRNLDHVKKVIDTQQGYARARAHVERFALAELLDDAFRVVGASAGQHGVELVADLADDLPRLETDRHRMLQILLNLLGNAIHAVRGTGARGRVVARARIDGARVRIEIADTGVGIAPGAMTQLFQHGFTTKPDGHGFGLHSSANAATELGGTLRATSLGTGHGATFILEIPPAMPGADVRHAA